MAYSLNPSSDNCYEGTTCLINKFGIKDEKKLSELEAQITFAKAVLLEATPIEGTFDFEHFKKIHEFLLCDIYDWAGQIRTVDISKKRTKFYSKRHNSYREKNRATGISHSLEDTTCKVDESACQVGNVR